MPTVFSTKQCKVEIVNPHFGQTGFLKKEVGEPELVYYDKGGRERSPREMGSHFSESQPGWVSFEELKRRKIGRCRAWKYSVEGQKDYLYRQERNRRRAQEDDVDERSGCYMRNFGLRLPSTW